MKSIGLYGDSYTGGGGTNSLAIDQHWSKLLEKHFCCDLINYGEAGSSIFYSYTKFQENYTKHDINIFIVTDPHRYVTPVKLANGNSMCLSNLGMLEWFDSNELIDPTKENLRGWFLASDTKFNDEMAVLMIEQVCKLDPKCLIIPSFYESTPEKMLKFISPGTPSPMDLHKHQCELYGVNLWHVSQHYKENTDILVGHLSSEYSLLMFDYIKNKIETGVWQTSLPFPDKLQPWKEVYTER